MKQWYTGMDCSSLEEVERYGGRFFDKGQEYPCLRILKENGANLIRIRLWNDPYSREGEPYGGGTNDVKAMIRLAQRAKDQGMDWLLDLHYSDFWADPQKQLLPKAWANKTDSELILAVHTYTSEILQQLKEKNLLPHMVAVGNEVTNGLLWPNGEKPNYSMIADLVSMGIRAVKSVDASILTMIHLDNGGRNDLYRDWFDHYLKNAGENFDCIGLSYYVFWHGSLNGLKQNMNDLARRYGKPLVVAETSMGFSLEDYRTAAEIKSGIGRGMAIKPELAARVPYPMTPEGQSDYMQDLMTAIAAVPDGMGRGFIYWEPAWLPVLGTSWATKAGCEYINEAGYGGNEWANQALFDYQGNALPALKTIKEFTEQQSKGICQLL